MGNVFSQINQGGEITRGLKHVDKSQMTHKNPALREKRTSPNLPPKPASLQRNPSGDSNPKVNKPAGKKVLDGSKWIIVEHFIHLALMERKILTAKRHQ
jgi:adenylyl cyclase-associated protein